MHRHAFALLSLFFGLFLGCNSTPSSPSASSEPSSTSSPPSSSTRAKGSSAESKGASPLPLILAYGSEKKTFLEEQIKAFQGQSPKTKSGRPIVVKAEAMGSGEAISSIVAGTLKPHVFSPASSMYLNLLNDTWAPKKSQAKPVVSSSEPVLLSPLVVAMWRPMAEALGWPGKAIGWSDLIKVSSDPKGWGALSHPEWGRFKLGHTHPEYSSSGLLSIVAEAYAATKKTRALRAEDLDEKPVGAFLGAVEQTIVHYGKSTGFFADKMRERGPAYLSAAVLYENLVIESYDKPNSAPFPIVALYPKEGTFWSDHPYAVLDAEWVGAEEREASLLFLSFLKSKPAQERALALGFRPADPSIPIGAPVDAMHGVDPKQPQTLLEVPNGATLDKLLGLWQRVKKTSDVLLVFDVSGSMHGKPLAEAKQGAKAFLDTLHERDEVTLVFFSTSVYPAIGPKPLGKSKADFQSRIDAQIADGKTALYDAIAKAYDLAKERAKKAPSTIHAVVVMTDGRDEGSSLGLPGLKKRLTDTGEVESGVKIFTIAYGDEADSKVLEQIAEAARGTSAKGNTKTIVEVYKDMAAFF